MTMCRSLLLLFLPLAVCAAEPAKPNIVFILCDDLGFGDVRCCNPAGKIATPHLDRLAGAGMLFTEAHSASAVCSPSRYNILTGRYNWRSRLKSGVLGGLSPRLIEEGRLTVAELLRRQGYYTAAIGKWHLGMDWARLPGKDVSALAIETPAQNRNVDYAKPIANGPTSVGFDEFFGISASLDMVPYTFIANNRVTVLPSAEKSFDMTMGSTRKTRPGPAAPDFDAIDVLPTLTRHAVDIIVRRAPAAKKGQPFFLYLPFASPHTPIVPSPEWQGKSGLSLYADFVMQTDDAVGQVLVALDRAGVADNTLVIFTSDNGCSPEAGTAFLVAHGHDPSGDRRGFKADIYDGGHREPFIVRWPGHVAAGARTAAPICLGDFMATCADLLGVALPADVGEDSISYLPVLLGRAAAAPRDVIVHHSINGSFAVRQGDWKLILAPGSGGWSRVRPGRDDASQLPPVQLYNVRLDVAETNNVQAADPEVVARLTALLEKQVADGRSTPGPAQPNTTPVELFKAQKAALAPLPAGKAKKAAKARPAATAAPAATESVVYKRAGGQELTLEILKPAGWKRDDSRPAVVFFHGGGWTGGTPSQFAGQARHFATRGLVSVLVRYRLLDPKGKEPPLACVQDAKSAIRWVRAHAPELGVDPQCLAVAGGSAGGHLAAFLGLGSGLDDPADDLAVSARAQALLLFNPVFDNSPGGWGTARVGDDWRQYSPLQMVAPGAPPAVVFVGSEDKLLPVKTVESFRDAMRAAGARCEAHVYAGQGHGFFNEGKGDNRYFAETLRTADEFLVSLGWLPAAR